MLKTNFPHILTTIVIIISALEQAGAITLNSKLLTIVNSILLSLGASVIYAKTKNNATTTVPKV